MKKVILSLFVMGAFCLSTTVVAQAPKKEAKAKTEAKADNKSCCSDKKAADAKCCSDKKTADSKDSKSCCSAKKTTADNKSAGKK